jgi:hypothetical protein|nr:MAG TPA: Bifunctional DNA primase polymerase [Caudoviricetes sp.]
MNKWNYIEKTFVDKFKIFPVIENGKTPVMNNWLNDCSSEYMQVLYWYENNHNYNWGLPAEPNNLFILDVDCKEGQCGKDSLARLMYDLDIDITKTLIQKTASGGLHLIYKSDVELNQVLNSSNSFENYPNIDIRTKGYIVVEPSVINGKEYTFLRSVDEIQEMPRKLKEFILNNTSTKKEIKDYVKPLKVFKGDRDNQLFQYINDVYYKTRLDEEEIFILAKHFNNTVIEEPLPERIVKEKVKRVFSKDRGSCIFIKLGE